jgi:hypothetical protein
METRKACVLLSALILLSVNHHAWGQAQYTVTDLGEVGGLPNYGRGYTYSEGVNDSGQVVGWCSGASYGACLYTGGVWQNLNNLPSAAGWTLTQATGINDLGQITGWGWNPSGQEAVFLLTPTPEPSTFALLAAGAIGLVSYGWRRRAASRPTNAAAIDRPDDTPPILAFPWHTARLANAARRAA